jgi:hypothetical protein
VLVHRTIALRHLERQGQIEDLTGLFFSCSTRGQSTWGENDPRVSRNELFVTTKLEAAYKTYAEAKAGIDGSLKALG